jgi:glycosyltransferase involved in cell wall biosynthesis
MTAWASRLDATAPPVRTMPRLSVSVLNHNYGHFLERCLKSILSQSYRDFDVVVIDDCSNDDSMGVIQPFLEDPRVRLIAHKQNTGFVRSLVEGVEASSSPYITVISADDFVLNDTAFERQMRLLEGNPTTSFCYAAWVVINTTTKDGMVPFPMVPFQEDHIWSGDLEFKHFCNNYYVLHTGTIIRRNAYIAVGGYDTSFRYAIDTAMWAMLCGAGDVAYVAEPLYAYRIHGSNMSRRPEALRTTVDELMRMVDRGFANLPEGSIKSDQRLLRRARQTALANVSSVEIFAGRVLGGLRVHAYAARLRPRDALFQRRVISLLARTLLGARAFAWLVKNARRGPTPRYKAG